MINYCEGAHRNARIHGDTCEGANVIHGEDRSNEISWTQSVLYVKLLTVGEMQ